MEAGPTSRSDAPDGAWTSIFLAWLVAAAATLGALFLGEVMGHTPCLLCWYQRIAMFPLVLILAAGLFPFDPRVIRYALPLAISGLLVAIYHLALVGGWIPESAQPCRQGVPCSETPLTWFGFLNLPTLSALAFAAIIGLLAATHFRGSK